jgi:hypothetical protein
MGSRRAMLEASCPFHQARVLERDYIASADIGGSTPSGIGHR